ncbi:DUF4365 domain-containing protein [Burkholderia arboris]|uniref:DUF4365 domain-containing protein n=1 Tax=Burkholderia arboris TaxID=488730 RepID=UPI001CF5DD71|nr:DUF4365 domain-containing protein [Burkholderia arboris]MCA8051100.1 DUF4365 domain-containing protein [Burkholderia arboris]
MPTRGPTHRIDTSAIRTIFTQLDADWLIRSLEERDYGIDLQLERFSGTDATGDFIFVQVKGTDSAFDDKVKLSGFPVDTLKYALMFNVPFFLFHTSNSSKATKFVWLQKYAETKLVQDTPTWESQGSVTVYFPEENDLSNNAEKIVSIIARDKAQKTGVKFIASLQQLKFHSASVTGPLGEVGVAAFCADVADKMISTMLNFIKTYGAESQGDDSVRDLLSLPGVYRDIYNRNSVLPDERDTISTCLDWLEQVQNSFLESDDMDSFAVEMDAYAPY